MLLISDVFISAILAHKYIHITLNILTGSKTKTFAILDQGTKTALEGRNLTNRLVIGYPVLTPQTGQPDIPDCLKIRDHGQG